MTHSAPNRSSRWVLRSILLWLTLAVGAFLLVKVIQHTKLSNKSIRVKGFAQKVIDSDLAVWKVQFKTRSSQLPPAYAKMEKDLARVMAYLKEHGVSESEIETSSISIETRNKKNEKGWETSEIEQYVLSRSLTIQSSHVDVVDRLSREITLLIKESVELSSQDPNYYYSKIDDLKIAMLGLASLDARERARVIAEKSSVKLGKLSGAQQGVFQITPLYSSEVSGEGYFDTSAMKKNIRAIITAEYSIQ